LGLILSALGLVLGACAGLSLVFTDNPDEMVAAAEGIADLTLPAGFQPEFTASAMDYTVVSYSSGQEGVHLYLLQSTRADDAGMLEEALAEAAPGVYDPQTRLTVLERQTVTVRGQEAALVISDGINGEGQAYRQGAVSFEGRGGPALLIYIAPVESWDRLVVNDLVVSIR
jgi:hypothetical protein